MLYRKSLKRVCREYPKSGGGTPVGSKEDPLSNGPHFCSILQWRKGDIDYSYKKQPSRKIKVSD